MKFQGTEVATMTTEQLQDALHDLAVMDNFRVTKLAANPKKAAKINPQENPAFTNLVNEINERLNNVN